MASQPSGNKQGELVSIETEKLILTIKGNYKELRFDYSEEVYNDNFFYNCIPSNELIDVSLYSNKSMFYEYQNYEIVIEDKEKHNIYFYHENKLLREQVQYTGKSKRVLTGVINFRGDIGLSEFIIYVDDKEHLIIRLEVFPTKIDYKKDYINILADINEEIHNLAFEFLKRTYLNMTLLSNKGNSLTEFYSILDYIYERLIKSINVIINQPHHELQKEKHIVPYHKLKKGNRETVKWLEKNTNQIKSKHGKLIPLKALQVNKTITVDTYENRFLKYMLKMVIDKLDELIKRYKKLKREEDEMLLEKIYKMKMELKGYLKGSFLSKVGNYKPKESFSLVLKMAAGYKEIYKYYLMLSKGLTLYGDVFKLSMKDLALLYEYWCFIKINSILRRKYKLIQSDIIKINNNGVFVTLKKGMTTKVKYLNPENGEEFTVGYNMSMKSETIPQKPDNIFKIKKDSKDITYNYIFDAKYRIDDGKKDGFYDKTKTVGPVESDINTMHRYRDAIVHDNISENRMERNIFGAFVLFPYSNEDEYKTHPFYKSIELVNVGGIPFLPNSTKLMEKFLDELIEESSLSAYERSLRQRGEKDYIKDSYFKDRNVLVGALRGKKQLEVNLKMKFYHTSLSNVALDRHVIKTVAIAQSKNLFKEQAGIRYYGKVKDIKIVKRRDIKEIPKDSDELYIRFEIEEWQELDKPLIVEGFQVRKIMYTTDYLLHNSSTVSELSIKDKEEFRLWMELKRLDREVKTVAEKDNSIKTDYIKGFKLNNKEIYITENNIKVIEREENKTFLRQDFRKKPKSIIRQIKNKMSQ